jgi:hypothetical protein
MQQILLAFQTGLFQFRDFLLSWTDAVAMS